MEGIFLAHGQGSPGGAGSSAPDAGLADRDRIVALRELDLFDTPPEENFDRLTRLASHLLDAPVALISVIEPERQFFKSHVGLAEPWASRRGSPLSHSFCQHAVLSGEPFVVEDARNHPLVRDNLAVRELDVVAYAGVPLRLSSGHSLGALCVACPEPRSWTQDELGLLSDLAATAVAQIELRAAMREARRAQALSSSRSEVLELVASDAPLEQVGEELITVLEGVSRGMFGSLLLASGDGKRLSHLAAPSLAPGYAAALLDVEVGASAGSFGAAAHYRRPVVVSDVAHNPIWERFRELAHEQRLRSSWAAPVLSGGELLGVLCLHGREPRSPSSEDLELLADGARLAAVALERHKAASKRAESEDWHRRMLQGALVPFIASDDHGIITDWNDASATMFGWSAREAVGRSLAELIVPERFRTAHRRGLERLAESTEVSLIDRRMELYGLHRDGHELPVEICICSLTHHRQTRFVAVLRDLSERRRHEAELRYLADHDPLTGLHNRRRFDEELARFTARAAREGEGGALVMIDLDGLKALNDACGHPAGDRALRHISRVVSDRARATDLVARLGGDEFAMLLDGAGLDEALAVARSICAVLRETEMELGGRKLKLTASAGAMVIRAEHGTPDGVLRRADAALYEAKHSGGDRVVAV